MLKLKRAAILALVVLIFGLGLYMGFLLKGASGTSTSSRTYSTPVLLQQVQTLSELVTVKFVLEKIEGLEVPSENVVGQALGSQNRVLLLAHGIVMAGVDLNRLTAEDLQVNGKQVRIKLPSPQITAAYLDETRTRIIDRKTGLLAPPDEDLEQTARQNAVDSIRRAARIGGILKEAEERAQTQLARLFLQLGFEKVEFVPAQSRATDNLNLAPPGSGERLAP